MNYVFSTDNPKRYRFPTHINDLVMDRSEAAHSEVFIVELAPGEAPPLHQHDDMEQVFYVIEGRGRLQIGGESEGLLVGPGDVVRIPVARPHRIHCLGATTLRYLAIDAFSVRPDSEPTWDAHVQAVCKGLGWNYDDVVKS